MLSDSESKTHRGQDRDEFFYAIFDIVVTRFFFQEYNSLSKASALKVNAALRKYAATPV